jgi:hypothetical protein
MIFISYRKEDAGDLAIVLAEKLVEAFGTDTIFLDRHKIELGNNWRKDIDIAITKSRVVLALIGQNWLKSYDEFGQRRIDRNDDVLAYELLTALQQGIDIIPLYLHGMKPLPSMAFPSGLAELAAKQGIEFDVIRDLDLLFGRLEKITGISIPAVKEEKAKKQGHSILAAKPWSVPDSLGRLFKGRNKTVEQLHERFHDNTSSNNDFQIRREVIHGLGGIGKTRLAIEYAWTYADDYNAVMFVVADSREQLRRSLSELTDPTILNLPEWKCPEEDTRMGAVIRWLSEHPGWLMIIDNADEQPAVDAVEHLLPKFRGGHVIITSRNNRWSKSVYRSELDVLPPEAASVFLLERTNEERRKTSKDEIIAKELASELGCLALALEQAGAYIQHHEGGLSLSDYLDRWRQGKAQVRTYCDKRLMHYERSIAATWETTMQALDPAAMALFRILAWYAPTPIPRDLLSGPDVSNIISKVVKLASFDGGEIDSEEALSDLIAYSMTKKFDEQGISCVGLHRLVLEITRERMPAEVKASTIDAAAELLVHYAPREAYRPETWQDWQLLIAHAEVIWEAMQILDRTHWNIELMKMLALYYLGQNNNKAVTIQREVLLLAKERYPVDNPEIFLAKNDLALMLDSSADEEKENLYKEALDGRQRICGEESEDVAETLFNYGDFLYSRGRLEEAELRLSKAFEIHSRVNGEMHWRTLMAENGLAVLLTSKKEYKKAEQLHLHAVSGSEKTLGKGHRDTYRNVEGYCNCLALTDRKEEAKKFLAPYMLARGLASDSTAYERRMIAADCITMGEYNHCEKLLNSVLEVNFEVPGTYCHLARVCLITNRNPEAKSNTMAAWDHRTEAPLYVIPRIIWFQLFFALSENNDNGFQSLLNKLKYAIQDKNAFMDWHMKPVLEQIKPQIKESQYVLLSALVDALSDKKNLEKLNDFAEWRDAKPEELD